MRIKLIGTQEQLNTVLTGIEERLNIPKLGTDSYSKVYDFSGSKKSMTVHDNHKQGVDGSEMSLTDVSDSADIVFVTVAKYCELKPPLYIPNAPKKPTDSNLKVEIMAYMDYHGIEYGYTDTKADLLEKIDIYFVL